MREGEGKKERRREGEERRKERSEGKILTRRCKTLDKLMLLIFCNVRGRNETEKRLHE